MAIGPQDIDYHHFKLAWTDFTDHLDMYTGLEIEDLKYHQNSEAPY